MRTLLLCVLLAVALALWAGGAEIDAQVSPLQSPILVLSEPDLDTPDDCRWYYSQYYGDLDASEPWTQYAIDQCIAALPPAQDGAWWRVADWMGRYPLWTNGREYRVGTP